MAQIRYRAIKTEPGLPEWLKNVALPAPNIKNPVPQEEIVTIGDGLAVGFWESMTPLTYRAFMALVRQIEERGHARGVDEGFQGGREAGRNEFKSQVDKARKEGYEAGHKEGYAKGFEVGQDMRDDA